MSHFKIEGMTLILQIESDSYLAVIKCFVRFMFLQQLSSRLEFHVYLKENGEVSSSTTTETSSYCRWHYNPEDYTVMYFLYIVDSI
jgi:hypothetical protein